MTENALTLKKDLKSIIRTDEVKLKFQEALGFPSVGGYCQNVLLAVSENPALQRCTPVSVIAAALRAATLRLSCDPISGQAYLVPFKEKATLVVGYKGLIHLAIRTGKYRYLNVSPVYEGETIVEDRITGMHEILGSCTVNKIIGHLCYFELTTGFRKSLYMSCQECEDHGRRYSRNYDNPTGFWRMEPEAAHRKTVLRLCLMNWGYLEPSDRFGLESEGAVVEDPDLALLEEATTPAEEKISPDQAMIDLGFGN